MPCPFDIHASLRTTIRRFYRNSRAPGHRPTGVVVFSIHTNRRWTSAGKSALTRPALAGRVVDRDNVDSQPAQRGFLVLVLHVGAGLAHGFDHFVEADEVGAVTLQCQRSGGDGFDRAHAVALDAGNLHQAADWIAGHAEVVLDADFGRVLDLRVRAAQRRDQARRRHRAGHADFALAADFGAGDRRVTLAQHADGGRRQHEIAHAGDRIAGPAILRVVAHHGRDDAGRAVGRRRDDAAASGVLLVDRHRVQAHLMQRVVRQIVGAVVRGLGVAGHAPQVGGAAFHFQAAGQLAGRVQPLLDAVAHHLPDFVEARVELRAADLDALVRAQHLRYRQTAGDAMFEHLVHRIEGIRYRLRRRGCGRLPFPFGADKAAADRVKHFADAVAVGACQREAHAVRVLGQRFAFVEYQPGGDLERYFAHAQQIEFAGRFGRRQLAVDRSWHHVLRRL